MGILDKEEDQEFTQEISTEVLYQQDKAQVDIQISTAKTYPRNVMRSIENAIAIATLDVKTASACTYSVPRGGKAITGPSVHLAKIIAQQWKNLRIESRVIDIDGKHITCQGICWDLENNIAIKTEVKRSIMTKNGRMNDDMITVTGNAGNSIALRNAIFAVIPKGVTDKVYGEALKKITGDVSDETKLIARRKQVFDALKDTYSLKEAEVLSAIGKSSISHVTAEDLVVIIGIGQAIKDGDTTVDLAFRGKEVSVANKKEEVKNAKKAAAPDTSKSQNTAKTQTEKTDAVEHVRTDTETDFYAKINACKTLEELTSLKPELPNDDLDVEIAYSDKKRELTSGGELFNKDQMK